MRTGRQRSSTTGPSDRVVRLLAELTVRPAAAAEAAAVATILIAAGTFYCALYCLIAFPMHRGTMPLSYSAAWAAHSLLPWFAAFELSKHLPPRGNPALLALRMLLCLTAAAVAAILLERVADSLFGIANTRAASLRAAAQLPGLTATAALILWASRRNRRLTGATTRKTADPVLPPPAAIGWIAAAGNYVEIHCEGRAILVRLTMTEVERLLTADDFVRIHRSTIVRRDRIVALAGAPSSPLVVLRGGSRLRVGLAYRANLRDWLAR